MNFLHSKHSPTIASRRPRGSAAAETGSLLREPFTLLHNLRTRPLAFVVAGLGLMGVLAVKTLLVRAGSAAPKPGSH